MTWPAPTPLPEAPPTTPDAPPPPPAARESRSERRERSGLPAATWIALLGGVLVLLAATSIVIGNWDAIGRTLRVIGLVAGTGGLLAVSERMRRLAPTTSNIVAHVGTLLTTSVGIAAMSLFGFTWPLCLVVGGGAALTASVLQADRWHPALFRVSQVGAVALMATGLADLTGTTGGLLAAIGAVVFLLLGAERRAATLALVAVLSPALVALADVGIGAGTFERAGLTGERLTWSGPTVGLLAAMVLAIVAQRRRNNSLMLAAAASPLLGIVTAFATVDTSSAAWLSVPALGVIMAELGLRSLPADRGRAAVVIVADASAATLASLGLLTPWLVRWFDLSSPSLHPWAVPTALTALAIGLTLVRWIPGSHRLTGLGLAGGLTCVLGTLIGLGAGEWPVAVVATMFVPVAAFADRRLSRCAVLAPACLAFVEIVRTGPPSNAVEFAVAFALTAIVIGTVVVARARLAADRGSRGWVEMGSFVTLAAGWGGWFAPDHAPAAVLVALAAVTVALALADRRWLWLQIVSAVAIGGVVSLLAPNERLGTLWIGWCAVSAGFVVVASARRDIVAAHAAAVAGVITADAIAVGYGASATEFVVLAMGATVLLTGLAFTAQRRTPLDAAAIAAGASLAAAAGLDLHPAWGSGIWFVLGAQAAMYGVVRRQPVLAVGGLATSLLALGSWWFTTGLDEWARELIAPLGVTTGDVWMFAATLLALGVGFVLRRNVDLTSWFAYAPGLVIGGLWLLSVQLERDTAWAIPTALTLGIVAAGAGAWHRLAAPLVVGTAITAVTTFVATGSDLSAVPTWSWLAVGGLGLLGLAVLIERTSQRNSTWRDLVSRWD